VAIIGLAVLSGSGLLNGSAPSDAGSFVSIPSMKLPYCIDVLYAINAS
jgi:hypothetical protein